MSRKTDSVPELPPLDPEALAEAARRMMRKEKPATGWPGEVPEEVKVKRTRGSAGDSR